MTHFATFISHRDVLQNGYHSHWKIHHHCSLCPCLLSNYMQNTFHNVPRSKLCEELSTQFKTTCKLRHSWRMSHSHLTKFNHNQCRMNATITLQSRHKQVLGYDTPHVSLLKTIYPLLYDKHPLLKRYNRRLITQSKEISYCIQLSPNFTNIDISQHKHRTPTSVIN